MIVVSQLDQTHMMRGLVTTLAKKGVIVAPASAPIVYQRINFDEEAVFGEISLDNDAFSAYQATLRQSIDDGYCSIISI